MPKIEITWELWPKQAQALESVATELLWGGAAGGGKSHLERIASLLWCLECPGLSYYLFRREYSDLIKSYVEGPTGYLQLLSELKGVAEYVGKEIRFTNGSKIFLSHCQHEKDVFAYNSTEFHVLNIAEAGEFTPFMIRYLRSRMRAPVEFLSKLPPKYKGLFPRALYTTNPVGPGKEYLKAAFVDGHLPGEIWQAPDDDGGLIRQFIPARLEDNPSIDRASYSKRLKGLPPAYVTALLNGDWNATVGAFFPEFSLDKHRLPSFTPPPHWYRYRTYDWGGSAPAVCFWWAVSDGEPFSFMFRGEEVQLVIPRGALVCYREWYIANDKDTTKGLAMRNEDMAMGIRERSIAPEEQRIITLTDSLPFQTKGNLGSRICDIFENYGVPLTQGDTSRISGWSQFRSRLVGTPDTGPMIYICACCPHLLRTIPMAQHDPVEPEELICTEDHTLDAARLACTARPAIIELDRMEDTTQKLHSEITFHEAIQKIQENKRRLEDRW